MELPSDCVLLRLYVGEDKRQHDKPVYETVVLKAREAGLAGSTVLRGPVGFGRSSRLHTAKILRLSTDLPLVIEIVDIAGKIDAFLESIPDLVAQCGLVTIEPVQVRKYG